MEGKTSVVDNSPAAPLIMGPAEYIDYVSFAINGGFVKNMNELNLRPAKDSETTHCEQDRYSDEEIRNAFLQGRLVNGHIIPANIDLDFVTD